MDCRVPGDGKNFYIFLQTISAAPLRLCVHNNVGGEKPPGKKEMKRTALASVGPALLIAAAAALVVGVCFLILGFVKDGKKA